MLGLHGPRGADPTPKGDRMTNYISWDNYPLRSGTTTPLGTVERLSDTAYLIEGKWLDHAKIHGPRGWAEPMVAIQ